MFILKRKKENAPEKNGGYNIADTINVKSTFLK